MNNIFTSSFYNFGINISDLYPWQKFIIVFFVSLFIFWIVRTVFFHHIHNLLINRSKNEFYNKILSSLNNIDNWFYVSISLLIAVKSLDLSSLMARVTSGLLSLIIIWQVISVITVLLEYIILFWLRKIRKDNGSESDIKNIVNLTNILIKTALWSIGILFVLSNAGVQVMSLLAGLGIGGVAVALALQGVLKDLFSSLSIYLDQPFKIGDFIVVGDDRGTVKKIGIKTTRIKTLRGEELVIANSELTSVRVQNFKRMKERRINVKFGVTYETPQNLVKEIPNIVKRIFDDVEGVRLSRTHFVEFGDSALIFEVVYIIESSDYVQYLNINQKFNLDLMEKFAELNISFAYPTQTIYTKTVSNQ